MQKIEMIIDAAAFKKLGIEVEEVLEYLENKKVITMKPIHVKTYQYLKDQPAVASS